MVDKVTSEVAGSWAERTFGDETAGTGFGCVFVFVVFVAMFIFTLILGANVIPAFLIAIAIAGGVVAFNRADAPRLAEERRQKYREKVVKIAEIVDPHMQALLRRRRQLSRIGDYGIRDDVKWHKEVNLFCGNIVFPALGIMRDAMPNGLAVNSLVFELVEVASIAATKEFPVQFNPNMSPIDYEHFCSERLKLSGWQPRVTQASGDQGADVVAVKGKATIVIQCKHYGTPVGNKAVQEIAAAVRHYSADVGIVVATNGFTKSAEQLAATNGVLLLSHDDLTPQWHI